jgi:hypothetical protein
VSSINIPISEFVYWIKHFQEQKQMEQYFIERFDHLIISYEEDLMKAEKHTSTMERLCEFI